MGNVLRRRRQPTEELEEITMKIKELETQIKSYMESKADFVRTLTYAMLALFGAGVSYLWFNYKIMSYIVIGSILLAITLIVFFIVLRITFITFFSYLIERKQKRIKVFNERKICIIEDVKENEKFKVAKDIIQKYSTENDLKTDQQFDNLNSSQIFQKTLAPDSARRETLGPQSDNLIKQQKLNCSMTMARTPISTIPKLHEINNAHFARTPVRPFVEQNRNPVDRILDYVMGESINNRYALICFQCQTHNGMALREEFEKITYFCFKCGTYNPSRNEFKTNQKRRNSISIYNHNSHRLLQSNNLDLSNNKSRSNYDLRIAGTRTPSIISLTTNECMENSSESIQTGGEPSREIMVDASKNSSNNASDDERQLNESMDLS